ncbi:MAG: MBG domain-containing protein, partial [Ilumatobacteraceae bacterium]
MDQSFTINAKSITVTADDKSKTAGGSDPAFTVTVTGGLVGS